MVGLKVIEVINEQLWVQWHFLFFILDNWDLYSSLSIRSLIDLFLIFPKDGSISQEEIFPSPHIIEFVVTVGLRLKYKLWELAQPSSLVPLLIILEFVIVREEYHEYIPSPVLLEIKVVFKGYGHNKASL